MKTSAGRYTAFLKLRPYCSGEFSVHRQPSSAAASRGGIKFSALTPKQGDGFQENILLTILQLERTFFQLAEGDRGNVLVVCDRGTMDPSAFCSEEEWHGLVSGHGLDSVQLRDARYDQIIHMVTAANGAEPFYQLTNNSTRTEGFQLARELDAKAAQAWVGHPYCDVIDNSTDFESKIRRVIEAVCKRLGGRLGVDIDDRLQAQSGKRKFLVKALPDIKAFPRVQDFDVQHDYLLSSCTQTQTRIRRRGQGGQYMYTHTERRTVNGEMVELIMQLTEREYQTLYKQRDPTHHAIHKTRRCFLWRGHYFQLDIFKEPCTDSCRNLLLLETYTTQKGSDLELPDFLDIAREVTGDPQYSMFSLSALHSNTPTSAPPHSNSTHSDTPTIALPHSNSTHSDTPTNS